MIGPRPDWVLHAACRHHPNPDLWYPDSNDHHGRQQAIAICRRCPVQHACTDHAEQQRECHGIWGGRSMNLETRKRALTIARTAL